MDQPSITIGSVVPELLFSSTMIIFYQACIFKFSNFT